MSNVKKYIDKALLVLTGILIAVMSVLSVWQVLARYILNTPSTTSEEVIRMLLIWFALTSAAYVFGQQKHIAIVFVRDKLPMKGQIWLLRLSNIILLFVAIVLMIWGGIQVVNLTLTQAAPSTGMSMAFMYGALPVAGLFVVFYAIYNLITGNIISAEEGSEQL
ncbi:TRAP transporter small permease [Oceanobacillus jeddahense]|uniref:TRAP transporter small permease n=1 Tax=Oceanobacillus jeddahense TaxID=1462527 RepID=A0ABY5JS17_9BACI|nr:TRAP transporter small permease [Oceanobacillus jeddahense]UUI03090.1 TRAP transporter small permease [Oceanobacillus jeddahense]